MLIETMENINSSMLGNIMYNLDTTRLTVVFKNNQEYFYDNVPAEVWKQFNEAESKGKFYARNIKGKYPANLTTQKEETELESILKNTVSLFGDCGENT